jgi:hypothetical protein
MSLQAMYNAAIEAGACVCDFDVACKVHPRNYCEDCELFALAEGVDPCPIHSPKPVVKEKPITHAQYRKAWIADWADNTGETKRISAIRFEQFIGAQWDGCPGPCCGGPKY